MSKFGMWGVALATVLVMGCDVEYGINQEGDGVGAPDSLDGEGTTGGENIPDSVERGDVQGRICAPDGETWVQGAVVYVDTEWGRLSTTTDVDGFFKLEGVPVGAQEVLIEKGSYSASVDVVISANELLQLANDECIGDVDIGVFSGSYDNIQSILQRLSIPYDEINGAWDDLGNEPEHIEFLKDPARMAEYDILFFNCGIDAQWTLEPIIVQNIRDYVENGGSIYASDQAYYVLEGAFPNAADFMGNDVDAYAAYVGSVGHVTGDIRNPALKSALGKETAEINYDLDSWASIEAANEAEVLIEGTFSFVDMESMDFDSQSHHGPLAVRHTAGSGVVLYTTFHNEPQITEDMDNLLREFVLSL